MQVQLTRASEGINALLAAGLQQEGLEVIYKTDPPGGPHGYYGFDVSTSQSVGVRFEPSSGSYFKKLGLWFMNNGQPNVPEVLVTLRNDKSEGGVSIPGEEILDEMRFRVSAVRWNPVLEEMDSNKTPYLEPGTKYWIVAESKAPPGESGVWVMAGHGNGFSSTTSDGEWQAGGEGAVPGTIVWGLPPVD